MNGDASGGGEDGRWSHKQIAHEHVTYAICSDVLALNSIDVERQRTVEPASEGVKTLNDANTSM